MSQATICALVLLDPSIRRNIFHRLDYMSAARLSCAYPELTNEIGTSVFRVYRASGAGSMYKFLTALFWNTGLCLFVEAMYLTGHDVPARSGFYKWMLHLNAVGLPNWHRFFPMMAWVSQFEALCTRQGATVVNGVLRGCES